jgi:hypothetical protein
MRVRANSVYTFRPVMLDVFDPKTCGGIKDGDRVRVVNLPGCPKANTMNHCHIETMDGKFGGLVCCNSLTKE